LKNAKKTNYVILVASTILWLLGIVFLTYTLPLVIYTLIKSHTIHPLILLQIVIGIINCIGGYGLWKQVRWAAYFSLGASLVSMANFIIGKSSIMPLGIALHFIVIIIVVMNWAKFSENSSLEETSGTASTDNPA
jgi:uncharacterized membrane protein (DUF2068 family)